MKFSTVVCVGLLAFVHAAVAAPTAVNDRYKLSEIIQDKEQLSRFYRFMDPADLVIGGQVKPNWLKDGMSFWYATGAPDNTIIFRVDGVTGKASPLFDVTRTRQALAALLGRQPPHAGLPFSSFTEVAANRYRISIEGADYILSTERYALEAAPRPEAAHAVETPRSFGRTMSGMEPRPAAELLSPDRRWFASLRDGNIMLRAPAENSVVALTADGTRDFSWDIASPPFPLVADPRGEQPPLNPWSPQGSRIFSIKIDRRAIPDFPVIRYLTQYVESVSVKMPRAGGAMAISHPHVIDVRSKHAQPLQLGDTENQYFSLIGWRPDGSEVLFARYARNFKTVDVLAGDAESGSVRTLFSESAQTFVAHGYEVIYYNDNHATILPDGSGLIWRSSRDGWNHFYLYAMDGKLTRALTKGRFPVIDVVSVDQKNGWVYFTAHHDQKRPYDVHLCRVKLTGGAIQRLTPLDGYNFVSLSPSLKTFTVVNSRPDRPFRTDFHASNGKHLATVELADVTALDALGYVAPEEFQVMAADGKTELWGVMYKPIGFDPKKTYPLIDNIYGGAQLTQVSHHFGLDEGSRKRLDRALAQLGYIVISVDARGTPERSKAFQDVVYGNIGRNEIPDHVATIRQLTQRHAFIDPARVGVWGHSAGGTFAVRAMEQAPEMFRVGVAAAPAADARYSSNHENYQPPGRNQAAYHYGDVNSWVHKITGKLLIAVGTSDPSLNAMKLVNSLIEAGVDHELVVLPDAEHTFRGKNDEYFVHKLVTHFERNLKARPQCLHQRTDSRQSSEDSKGISARRRD